MTARLRSWWQKIKQRWVAIAVTTAIIMAAIALIIIGYRLDVTGFNGYTQVSTIHTLGGPTAGTVTRTETYQSGKTLWDWMQLLIIPVALALLAVWFNRSERKNDRVIAQQRAGIEQAVASDNQQEAALQSYLDRMSELLLDKHLRESKPNDEVRNVARVRTLTMLFQLDTRRINYMFAFLRESGLISLNSNTCIITFIEADLSMADLHKVNLYEIDLSKAKLNKANLNKADLHRANLSEAELYEANLRKVKLSEADLSKATLSKADLREADLGGANLTGAEFDGAALNEADLSGANLYNANLKGANLIDANLSDANLNHAILSEANFTNAYFNGANLTDSYIRGANLTRASLIEANLTNTNLANTNLSGANLTNANLTEANLIGADLSGANLRATKMTKEQLTKAKSLKGATMTDGSIHP